MSESAKQPTVLIILDGWGHREEIKDNAIANGNTPVWDRLWREAPHTLVSGSGLDVGLPAGQMGNSEVGHMNIGAGRIVEMDLCRINRIIAEGRLGTLPVIQSYIENLKSSGRSEAWKSIGTLMSTMKRHHLFSVGC